MIARHNPIGRSDYLSIQHIERYRFALSRMVPGMRVLDIACGIGYGTALLRRHGCAVVSADYDSIAVRYAKTLWSHEYVVHADALALPFAANAFDAVVSFETIEHVVDNDVFLAEMKRVLRPGGIFICSTPNIRYTSHPPYHVREYEPEEFYMLIEDRFSDVERYGQYFKSRDRLLDVYNRTLRGWMYLIGRKISIRKERYDNLAGKEVLQMHKAENPCSEIDGIISGNPDSSYKVQNYRGLGLLRIMVTAARKEG